MKDFVFIILFVLLLLSCSNRNNSSFRNEEYNKYDAHQNDSIAAMNRAINAFNKSALACKDSISKYKIASINDTCIKHIYIIYGTNKLKNYDSLIVAWCTIKLTDFKKVADSEYRLHYTLFIKDSIPIIADLSEEAIIHCFEYSDIQKKITKAFLGQHNSYVNEKELSKLYYSSFSNKSRKYFTANFSKLHPDFIRLVP